MNDAHKPAGHAELYHFVLDGQDDIDRASTTFRNLGVDPVFTQHIRGDNIVAANIVVSLTKYQLLYARLTLTGKCVSVDSHETV